MTTDPNGFVHPGNAPHEGTSIVTTSTEPSTGSCLAHDPAVRLDAFGHCPACNAARQDAFVQGVLDGIVSEAHATHGRLKVGVATAILILERAERYILSPDEARRVFAMAPDTAGVCFEAFLTRGCPLGHEWISVVTNAGESFDIPFGGPSHESRAPQAWQAEDPRR